jgi:hypothetical protein
MLDAALRATAHGIATQRPALFDGERLRFPRPPASGEDDPTHGRLCCINGGRIESAAFCSTD